MTDEVKVKKKTTTAGKDSEKVEAKRQPSGDGSHGSREVVRKGVNSEAEQARRRESLQRMLLQKRQEIMTELEQVLGRSLTQEQQRRLESAMDVGDQSIVDLERELGISLLEMQNRKRQLIDEALTRLAEGTYGKCAECGVEISEKRLAAVPFAKLCVECQSRQELLEKIEKEEERE